MVPSAVQDAGRIAILIPCYNEALTIEKVIRDFQEQLPDARIYVYDNNSTDDTALLAQGCGAIVKAEKNQGKGFVVRSMFRDVDADVYVMVDGDDTYPADRVHELIRPVAEGRADMVVGNRLTKYGAQSFRPLHVFGNQLVVRTINSIFWARVEDVMSGYRVFSRDFVKSVPIVSRGFEIETELTLQALYRNFVTREVPVPYGERPEGSVSKLRTYRDGARVLLKILDICKAYRPLLFFSALAAVVGLLGLAVGSLPVAEFLEEGAVRSLPAVILASALGVIAALTGLSGLILDSIKHHFREQAELIVAGRFRQGRAERRNRPIDSERKPHSIAR